MSYGDGHIHGRGNRGNTWARFVIKVGSYPLSVAGMSVGAGLYMAGAVYSLLQAGVPLTPENGNAFVPVEAGAAAKAAWIAGGVSAASTLAFVVMNNHRLSQSVQLAGYRIREIEQVLVTTLRVAASFQAVIYPAFLAMNPGVNPRTAYLGVTAIGYSLALCARSFPFGGPSEGFAGLDSLYHLNRGQSLPQFGSDAPRLADHHFTTGRLNRYALGGVNASWALRLMPETFKPHLNKPSYFYPYALIETFYFLGMMKLAIDAGAATLGLNPVQGFAFALALTTLFLPLADIGRVWAETRRRQGPAEASASHPVHWAMNFAVALASCFVAIASVAELVVPGSSRGLAGSGPVLLGVGALLAAVFAAYDASATAYVQAEAIKFRDAKFPSHYNVVEAFDSDQRLGRNLGYARAAAIPGGVLGHALVRRGRGASQLPSSAALVPVPVPLPVPDAPGIYADFTKDNPVHILSVLPGTPPRRSVAARSHSASAPSGGLVYTPSPLAGQRVQGKLAAVRASETPPPGADNQIMVHSPIGAGKPAELRAPVGLRARGAGTGTGAATMPPRTLFPEPTIVAVQPRQLLAPDLRGVGAAGLPPRAPVRSVPPGTAGQAADASVFHHNNLLAAQHHGSLRNGLALPPGSGGASGSVSLAKGPEL